MQHIIGGCPRGFLSTAALLPMAQLSILFPRAYSSHRLKSETYSYSPSLQALREIWQDIHQLEPFFKLEKDSVLPSNYVTLHNETV